VIPTVEPARKKLPLLPFGLGTVVVLAGGFLILRGFHISPGIIEDRILLLVRGIGPGAFFVAMALLPAVGIPLLAFTLVAGEAFAPQMGLSWVIAVSLTVVAFNLALSYWLAHSVLRPLLSRITERFGYQIPRVTRENALSIILLVHLTGAPYSFQCYLLGLAEAPFRLYLIVSWICLLPWSVGAIVFGEGILNGNFKTAATGIAVLTGAVFLVRWFRRKLAS